MFIRHYVMHDYNSYCSRVGGQCQQAAKDCNNIRHQLQYLLKRSTFI